MIQTDCVVSHIQIQCNGMHKPIKLLHYVRYFWDRTQFLYKLRIYFSKIRYATYGAITLWNNERWTSLWRIGTFSQESNTLVQ